METRDPIDHTAAPDAEFGASAADETHLDEEDYIRLQARQAKEAMSATLHEMSEKLKNVGDVRVWTQHYPWIATGLAAGAGFLAGMTIIPKSKQEAVHAWESIKSTFTPSHEDDHDGHDHHGRFSKSSRRDEEKHEGPSWISTLIAELIKIVRPLLLGFLANNFGGRGEPTDSPPDATKSQDQ